MTTLRPVRRSDAARLAALLTQLGYPAGAGDVDGRLAYWLDAPGSALLGAEVDGRLVGVVALHVSPMLERTGFFGRIVALVVDEAHRGRRVGRTLVAAAEERARALGCTLMEITSSRRRTDAHAFYRALEYDDVCPKAARFVKFL